MWAMQIPNNNAAVNGDNMGPYKEIFNDPTPEAAYLGSTDVFDCYINEFNSQKVTMNLDDYEPLATNIAIPITNKCDPTLAWPFKLPARKLLSAVRPFVCAFPLPSGAF